MPETLARWKIVTGYVSFSVVTFVISLYVTFPFDAVKDRIVSAAADNGWTVTMASIGPGLFGITADGVRVNKVSDAPVAEGAEIKPSEPLSLGSVSARPSLFPLGVAVRAHAFGGSLSAALGLIGNLKVDVSADELDPSLGNVKGFTGIDLAGKLSGELTLEVPTVETHGHAHESDFSQANGSLQLKGDRLQIKGGTATIPLYGAMTPVDLPAIAFGDLDAAVKIDKGLATVDKLHAKSDDLELSGSGTVKLAKKPDFSELALEVRLKPDPAFLKRLGMIGGAVSMLPVDSKDPTYRLARINGYLGRPNLNTSAR